jgi:hypothetical protein
MCFLLSFQSLCNTTAKDLTPLTLTYSASQEEFFFCRAAQKCPFFKIEEFNFRIILDIRLGFVSNTGA